MSAPPKGILKAPSSPSVSEDRFFPGEPAAPSTALPIAGAQDVATLEDDFDDPDGRAYAGPAVQSVPTSMTTMRLRRRSRNVVSKLLRRGSESEGASEFSDDASMLSESSGGYSTERSRRSTGRRGSSGVGRRGSTSTGADRRSTSTRRDSVSTRRDSTDIELLSGPDSSDSSDSDASDAPRPRGHRASLSGFIPGFADPFGATDYDADDNSSESEDGHEPLLLFGASSASAATQTIYIPEEDLTLRIYALGVARLRATVWLLLGVLTLGLLPLIARWYPRLWIRHVAYPTTWNDATRVVVESSYAGGHHPTILLLNIGTLAFERPVALSSIFPASLAQVPPTGPEDVQAAPPPVYDQEPATPPEDAAAALAKIATKTLDLSQTRDKALNELLLSKIATPAQKKPADASGASSPTQPRVAVQSLKYIDYRYYRLILHPVAGDFRMIRDWKDPSWTSIAALRKGIKDDTELHSRQALFGANTIDIAAKSTLALLLDEVLHPFYVFQLFSIVLWSFDDYYYYACAIAAISVLSISATLIETKANVARMREMSRFVCPVDVLRGRSRVATTSDALVPGDVIDLAAADLTAFPADILLLSGDAIVNEAMLTGESVPVSKVPAEPDAVALLRRPGELHPDLARHVVYCSTKVVRVRKTAAPGAAPEALGVVLRTGFNTTKGALVRSMLFPKPFGFAFYRDSFRFIGILGLIAVLGFVASSFNFVRLGIAWSVIVVRALDLVTIVVPPALPATMSIGTSFAIARLRERDIFCIAPTRVNVGGKVNVVCFDKTGTLTEEGLDVLGVHAVTRTPRAHFGALLTDPDAVPVPAADAKTPLLHALATCHALKLVDGTLVGDPLDLKMFDFTQWSLEEGAEEVSHERAKGGSPSNASEETGKRKGKGKRLPRKARERAAARAAEVEAAATKAAAATPPRSNTPAGHTTALIQLVVRPPGGQSFELEEAIQKAGKRHAHFLELGVLRTFDFVSQLRRMAVLVKKLKSNSVEAYVKGAPEVMADICDPATMPDDYEETLADYTRRGFRVIALAGKTIPNLTWLRAQRLAREEVETGLRFLGLIVFENKLKLGTTPAIGTLRNAHIPQRMVTGDNVQTAVSVAKECTMINPFSRVYLPRFVEGDALSADAVIEWADIDDADSTLDPYTLKPLVSDIVSDYDGYSDFPREYHLAVTGDVFRWILDFGTRETLHRMLVKGIVYARMSPDEKHELVECLQSLGYTVGFCGDGANDCGALKAADVGISLSEAEASVAAPFTSRQPDIRCMVDVLKEGRAALVTSFSCFKFMALYSLIQFTTVTLLYAIAGTLGDFQFLYIDLFLILPIAVTMGRTEPYGRLHPKRPTSSLVSKRVLSSLVGQIVLTTLFQIIAYVYVQHRPWYQKPIIDPEELDIVSYENTTLFLVSSFQYVLVAVVFCVGPPYRRSMYTNRWLMAVLVGLCVFSMYTLFATTGPVVSLLQLIELPHEFRLELFLLVLANVALSYAFEQYFAEHVAIFLSDSFNKIFRARDDSAEQKYKALARDMEV